MLNRRFVAGPETASLALALAAGFFLTLAACGDDSPNGGDGDEGCSPVDPTSCPAGFTCTIVPPSTDFQCVPAAGDTGTADVDPDTDAGTEEDTTDGGGGPSEETICDDGQDDDGDGAIDCDDDDCEGDAACDTTEVCDDGTDNDGDGQADCDDDDCADDAACIDPEICDDGEDNDGDGRADCADADCIGTEACPTSETSCDDGEDNDNDGLADCADLDCEATPICPESNCGNRTDDNNDGLVDCADPTCADVAPCGPEGDALTCSDGLDNDNDGDRDCEDADCDALDICIVDYVGYIAYQGPPAGGGLDTVFLLASDGSEGPFPLESGSLVATSPRFSPDGTRLAYRFSNIDGQRIRVLDLTTGVRTDYALDSLSSVSQPAWSPDGTEIVVVGRVGAGEGPEDIFVIGLAGDTLDGPLTTVGEGRFVGSPLFSGDGSRIYFVEGVPGQVDDGAVAEIWAMDRDGSNAAAVTDGATPLGRMAINNDGSRIVYRKQPAGLFYFNTETETIETINTTSTANSPSFFGRTNRLVASIPVTVGDSEVSDLVILDASSGAVVESITETSSLREGAPVASPVDIEEFPLNVGD